MLPYQKYLPVEKKQISNQPMFVSFSIEIKLYFIKKITFAYSNTNKQVSLIEIELLLT
jgi:hypothetical protein